MPGLNRGRRRETHAAMRVTRLRKSAKALARCAAMCASQRATHVRTSGENRAAMGAIVSETSGILRTATANRDDRESLRAEVREAVREALRDSGIESRETARDARRDARDLAQEDREGVRELRRDARQSARDAAGAASAAPRCARSFPRTSGILRTATSIGIETTSGPCGLRLVRRFAIRCVKRGSRQEANAETRVTLPRKIAKALARSAAMRGSQSATRVRTSGEIRAATSETAAKIATSAIDIAKGRRWHCVAA